MSIYVCSDIHGRYGEWQEALSKTDINLDNGDKLFILGDLIDRGEHSLECVSLALNLIRKYPNQVVYLIGNHEKMMIDFLDLEIDSANDDQDFLLNGETWIGNGGSMTIYSFLNGLPHGSSSLERLKTTHELMWLHHRELINELKRLPYYHVERDFVFVHAGLESNKMLIEQDKDEMVWIREEFFNHFYPHKELEGKTIIHGHTPVPYFPKFNGKGYYEGAHHICVDGGSAMERKLLILKIDHNNHFSYVEQIIKRY